MSVRPDVVEYLRTNVGRYPDDALRDQLIHDGVSAGEVDDAFTIINLRRPPSHITDRGRAPKAAQPKNKGASWLKRLLLFGAGAVFFGLIIGTGLLIRKLGSPETRQWLKDLQHQAAALSAPGENRAVARKKSPEARLGARL